MPTPHVVILGAGAAGTAAARVLKETDAVTVDLVARTAEIPYNRTLMNKAVVVGLLTSAQAAMTGVHALADTAEHVDREARTARLASGRILPFDALIIATGSAPRKLEGNIPGARDATDVGLLTALHSLEDAVRIRDLLARQPGPARIVIFGAGLVAAETASLLRAQGHQITLVARSRAPGATAFGGDIAARLEASHREHLATAFGRTPTAFEVDGAELAISLDDGSRLQADIAIVAHGTEASGPAPWGAGVGVDERLRTPYPRVYAAGGSAIHHDDMLGTWRIDHWADAVAQGEHAARVLLHDFELGTDPGRYLPRSPHVAFVHGMTVAAVGMTGAPVSARVVSQEPLVVVDEGDVGVVGAAGLDALPDVMEWTHRLHAGALTSSTRFAPANG